MMVAKEADMANALVKAQVSERVGRLIQPMRGGEEKAEKWARARGRQAYIPGEAASVQLSPDGAIPRRAGRRQYFERPVHSSRVRGKEARRKSVAGAS